MSRKFEYLSKGKVKPKRILILCQTCNTKFPPTHIVKLPGQDSNNNDTTFLVCLSCANMFIQSKCSRNMICHFRDTCIFCDQRKTYCKEFKEIELLVTNNDKHCKSSASYSNKRKHQLKDC